mmetsp:Transcript_29182/g.68348  ORF Transcript_29182/g.68348 Transcript_29182/m.68348 type:complete len:205 (+) Transcript_29182:379-993(+)
MVPFISSAPFLLELDDEAVDASEFSHRYLMTLPILFAGHTELAVSSLWAEALEERLFCIERDSVSEIWFEPMTRSAKLSRNCLDKIDASEALEDDEEAAAASAPLGTSPSSQSCRTRPAAGPRARVFCHSLMRVLRTSMPQQATTASRADFDINFSNMARSWGVDCSTKAEPSEQKRLATSSLEHAVPLASVVVAESSVALAHK